jgi:2-polyprenyl-3-methyl-5-hydroxy-6-metoxy-1,4-benzoquinol methylase
VDTQEGRYRLMVSERVHVPSRVPAWPAAHGDESTAPPVDEELMVVAADLAPGRSLELGCGVGQNSIWLAQRGWLAGGVDASPSAIRRAVEAAQEARVDVNFQVQDVTSWRPRFTYDLVIMAFSVPPRGTGRSRTLEMAAAAVAPGGTILLRDFDVSLRREGWMSERYLVSTEELARPLESFRITRSMVRLARHTHGLEQRVLPVATVVATRRSEPSIWA